MTLATTLLLVAGGTAGLVLLWRLPVPRPAGRRASVDGGDVTVVIPARDEAPTLPGLLADLAVQSWPPREVVVVDDASEDGTAQVAVVGGARVVDPGLPAPGWVGKPWALSAGLAAVDTERVVLLDADVRLAPDALERLLAEHDRLAPDGLLSVQPFHVVHGLIEQASLFPNVVALLASGVGAVRPADRIGLAFGPCIVTTRAALAAVGGLATVRDAVLEDASLARAFEDAGRSVAVLGGGPTVSFRMFRSTSALVHGWTRLLAAGAGRARPVPMMGAVLWVAALVALVLELHHPTAVVAVAYGLAVAQLGWMARRAGSFHPLVVLLFPLPLLAFVLLFAGSVVQRVRRRPAVWRGRRVPVS